jgi:hypothetical protein
MFLTGVEFDHRQSKQGPNRVCELNYILFSVTDLRYVNIILTEQDLYDLKSVKYDVGFIKSATFWGVKPCSPLELPSVYMASHS